MRLPRPMRYPSVILGAALMFAQACGSGSGSTGTTTSSITLSISPTSATVQVGGSTTVSGTIVRTNFTGDIALAATNLPSGVTAALISAPTNGGNTGSVSLTATSAATPGTYPITVTASGSGISSVSQNFSLTIAAASSSFYAEALSVSALSVAQGATGITTVTYTRSNFTGGITPSVDNLPTGVTAVFSVNPVTGATSVLTLTVGSSVTAGVYNMDVRGVASGLTDVTTPLTLTVTATAGSYTMALSSSTQSIAQGANANNVVTITRTNFAGNITLSVVNLPIGVTASFSPNPATAGTSTLTLTVGSSVIAGPYNLTVTGAASGLANVTAPLALTATSSGGVGNVTLDYSACAGAGIPVWVAFQDGNGAWTHIAGTDNVYHFTVSSSKGGYAAVTNSNGTAYTTAITYMAAAELTNGPVTVCTTPSSKTVDGTMTGLSVGDAPLIALGGGSEAAGPVSGAPIPFEITNVAPGNQTMVAYRHNSVTPSTDKVIVRPNQNIASGGSLALVDFGSSEAVSAVGAPFTFIGVAPGDTFTQIMEYLTTAACVPNGLYAISGTNAANSTQFGIPSGQQASTDFHQFSMTDANASNSAGRSIEVTFHTFGAQTITLPALLPAGTVTVLPGGIGVRRQVALTLPSDYSAFSFTYADAAHNAISIQASGLYLGGPAVTLGMPDFSAAGGYLAIYGPAPSTLFTVNLSATGSSGAACTEGAMTKAAFSTSAAN